MPSAFNKDAILRGDVAQMRALFAAASPPAKLNQLYRISAGLMVDTLLGGDQLDEVFAPLVAYLKHQLITKVAHDSYFYTDPLHPIRRLLDYLLKHACYWYPRDAKQQTRFLQQYQQLIDGVVLHPAINASGIWGELGVFSDFNRWIDAEYKRAELLESRVCQAAVHHFGLLEAEYCVLNLINNSFAGKNIPVDAYSLIIGALKSELQYNLINEGVDSSFWHSWSDMLPVIARLFHTNGEQDNTHHDFFITSALTKELQNSLQLNSSNPDNYQLLISRLIELLSRTAKQPLRSVLFKALPYPEGSEGFNRHIMQHLQADKNGIKVGSWIIVQGDEGQKIRCKLALKNTISNQLLFVDYSGRKVMIKSLEEFLLCLDSGTAKQFRPISFHDFFSHLLDKLIAQAKLLAEKQKTSVTKEKKIAHKKQKEVAPSNEAAPRDEVAPSKELIETQQKMLKQDESVPSLIKEDTTQITTSKKKTEASALAEEKKRQSSAQKAKENTKHDLLTKLTCAKEQAAALNVGARVTIHNGEHGSQRCKLAAIIPTTGKYIFADSRGQKFAEYQYEQLIEAIVANKLQVISSGDIFEDRLAKVIRGYR